MSFFVFTFNKLEGIASKVLQTLQTHELDYCQKQELCLEIHRQSVTPVLWRNKEGKNSLSPS